ncbi:MAG: acyl-CoA thioester hydrolase/BAAT C-terminal domain-containing protein [Candidatus Promineifilaceae bacterium]|nr:acyl-CoA thioester hydrolase/BAAT C-terminal domain-containing protein [Candidatus Promineifilaceae bacterium]
MSTATPTSSPPPPVTSTTPASASPASSTPAELPNGMEALRRSQEMMMALPAVGLEGDDTIFLWPSAPPLTQSYRGCLRLTDAGGLPSQMEMRLPGGIIQSSVCEEAGAAPTCYTQVEEHPWFRDPTVEQRPSWPQERAGIVATATVTDTVAEDGAIWVRWQKEDWPVEGALLRGESWLERNTLRPRREALTWHWGSTLLGSREIRYTTCEPVARAETPPTVTPAATVAPPAEEFEIREESAPLPGVLYVPEGEGPFPAVVVLHGSEGGVRFVDGVAQRLARGGLVAFALCYFGCLETPWTLENVEISRVSEAIAYLRHRPDTAGGKVGVVGFSRGAELALIMGVLDASVGPVVSIMTSPWVYGSPDSTSPAAAWVYEGEPLPFAAIPVEQIEGPVLLLHGQEDHLWPVGFAYTVAERLAAHDHAYELVVYPHRGHELNLAPRDVPNRATAFLHEHLAP